MFRAWGEPVPTSTSAVKAVHSKAVTRAKQLKMGQYEKADDVFYFEHEWEPVEGHPHVGSCAVCGLNRFTMEHTEAAQLAHHERVFELRLRATPPLPAEVAQRLYRDYGPQSAGVPIRDEPHDVEVVVDVLPAPAEVDAAAAPILAPSEITPTTPVAPAPAVVIERVVEGQQPNLPAERAFVTEVNGKTLITGRASAFQLERALQANEHFLWMSGRFVGAEKANRNGAFWSTADLELGQVSVQHGPLNWLHESRHVIGTIAHAQLVTREEAADRDLSQPYIQATSAIWKWIYPDEAYVVEQASDAGKLWYSMECISKEVACVGETGCGATASYGDYLQGAGGSCDHMRQRSAERRFAEPTFLGGAVIVPPVRPGWAEADATVMRQAASLAEGTYEQACPIDTSASDWEQLMAQVLRYAGGR